MNAVIPRAAIALIISFVLNGCLAAAPLLSFARPDAGLIAAPHSISNSRKEGITTGIFEALYPGIYPGYGWAREVREIGSNGLFQAEYLVFDETQAAHSQHALHGAPLTILLFRPRSIPSGEKRQYFAWLTRENPKLIQILKMRQN